jgi:hypothetical protein
MPAPPLPRADLIHSSNTSSREPRVHGGGALAPAFDLGLVVLDMTMEMSWQVGCSPILS